MTVNLQVEMNRLSKFLEEHAPLYVCERHGVSQTRFFVAVSVDAPANAQVTLSDRVIKAYHIQLNGTSIGKRLCKTLQTYALLHNFKYEGPIWQ